MRPMLRHLLQIFQWSGETMKPEGHGTDSVFGIFQHSIFKRPRP